MDAEVNVSKVPVMILMKGHPGSGKSTIARGLAHTLKAALADKDDARDCFQQYAVHACVVLPSPTPPRESGAQSLLVTDGPPSPIDWNALSYDVMFQVATTQLRLGMNVVVDCPLARPHLYHRAQAIARQCGARIAVVECWCSDELEWRRRLEQRALHDSADEMTASPQTATSGSIRSHKPGTWQQLQDLLASYHGCWEWSTDGTVSLPCYARMDTTRDRPQELLLDGTCSLQGSQANVLEIVRELERQLACKLA